MTAKKQRLIYFSVFAALIAVEVFIALFVHDSIIRPFGGDVIVVWVVYFFIRGFIPERVRLLPLYVLLFAFFIETLQYFRFIDHVWLGNYSIFRTLLGTSFSWIDIGCYVLGCIPLALFEIIRYIRYKRK